MLQYTDADNLFLPHQAGNGHRRRDFIGLSDNETRWACYTGTTGEYQHDGLQYAFFAVGISATRSAGVPYYFI